MNVKDIVDRMMEGIKFYINERLKSAPYDKTDTAIVVGVSEFGYNVKYNGKFYSNVNTIGGICSINESVKILIPQNNINNIFIVKGSTNHDIIDVQNEINQLELNKLDKTGDSSNTTATFTESSTRINIISGETLSTLFGKIKKWFTDLKTIAFTGNASDLTQDPNNRLVTDTEKTTWSSKSPTPHDSINSTYGMGTANKFGHVKLSDDYTLSSGDASSGIGASSLGLYNLYNYVKVNSRELTENITLYVATTGSDTTGDGTSGNPFKTIQHTLSTIPKDLGGYNAYIYVADGTYDEGVVISGFYNGVIGIIKQTNPLSISTNCSVRWIAMQYCSCRIYLAGLNLFGNGSESACVGIACTDIIIHFMAITSTDLTKIGFSFDACRARVENCKVINHNIALRSYNSYCGSATWTTDSTGNNIGLSSDFNSVIVPIGAQPQATLIIQHYSGGAFINENGTQISGVYTSGLSCTWGNIQGGYIRNGTSGVAIITIVCTVISSTNLSTGTPYYISGFPRVAGISRVSVSVQDKRDVYYCFIDSDGTLQFVLDNPLVTGSYLIFNCTYMTDL